jgi:hypothetical protein
MSAPRFGALADALKHPAFAPLRDIAERFLGEAFPTLDALNAARADAAPRFVPPEAIGVLGYERSIDERGEISTRADLWHDFFNALIWLGYPLAKRRLSAVHAQMLRDGGEAERRRRSPTRDALTLFDEGGAVVLSAAPEVFDLIERFAWRELFWDCRAMFAGRYAVLIFGHAALERLLAPQIGLTVKTLFCPCEQALLDADPIAQRRYVDQFLDRAIATPERWQHTRQLAPLPLLGVPGYFPRTEEPAFYALTDYFRPNYTRAPRRSLGVSR